MTKELSTIVKKETPTSFVLSTFNQEKIRDIKVKKDYGQALGVILAKSAALSGLKGEMDNFNLKDIKDLVDLKYTNLSIEEIEYAFKGNRYELFGKRIEMFNLFNAPYVASVIDAYIEWKTEKIRKENLLSNKNKVAKESLKADEKKSIVVEGIVSHYEAYKETKEFNPIGGHYVFDVFIECGIIKKYHDNKEEYDEMIEQAKSKAKLEMLSNKSSGTLGDYRKSNEMAKKINNGESNSALNIFKKDYVVKTFEMMLENNVTTMWLRNRIGKYYKPD